MREKPLGAAAGAAAGRTLGAGRTCQPRAGPAMGRTCVCTRRGRARGGPGGLCRHFYVRRSEGAAPQPPPEARPPGPCPPPWDPRAAAPAMERGAREAVSGESARALKRSVCDPRSPPAHGVRWSHCQRWWRPVPAALEPWAGGLGVGLGPFAPLGGAGSGDVPPPFSTAAHERGTGPSRVAVPPSVEAASRACP